MVTLEKAQELVLRYIDVKDTESAFLLEAEGRVLAEDIFSPIDNPPFPRSPLDGYAVRAGDLEGASKENPKRLKVIDKVYAGYISKLSVSKNTAIRIMTGAPIPIGADCVIRQEDTKVIDNHVDIFVTHKPYEDYCSAGEDFKRGTKVLARNIKLTSSEIMTIATLGFNKVLVYKKPVVGILTVGDELQEPGAPLKKGKIYNSNCYFLYARLLELGAIPKLYKLIEDDDYIIAKAIEEAEKQCDILVSTGGVSVGEKDRVKESARIAGYDILFWKVAIKPGSPMFAAAKKDKVMIGLSGTPVAAATTFELIVRPMISKAIQYEGINIKTTKAVMEDDFSNLTLKRRFLRVKLVKEEVNKVYINNIYQSPGQVNTMLNSNAILEVKPDTEIKRGDIVDIILIYK